jgi:hypothetical protein
MAQFASLLFFSFLVTGGGGPQFAGTRQSPSVAEQEQAAGPQEQTGTMDVFDLLRKLRHKEPSDEEHAEWDYRRPMIAAAPVIGAKPSSGLLVGVAGNVAFYRGEPATTHISSLVASLTFSSKKQTAISGRFTMFTRDDRWRVDGDNRLQWTSLNIYDLGTSSAAGTHVNAKYDFFRVYETGYFRLRPSLFAGVGLHFNDHANVRPGSGVTEETWAGSPFVQYSQEHGFALDAQISAGGSLNLLMDNRDNAINADRGWLANGSYRTFFKDFLGGDSTWQELHVDLRTYAKLTRNARQKLAFWLFGDFVVGGVAPYMDLPATAMDTYGRSGRGYSEGRFRGERLLYGEIEYRATLMRSGLVGMVAFLNATTVTNLQTGERLFHTVAPGGGLGLRLLINKHSKTNLCLDFGLGTQGSHGVYLAIQEAF